MKNQEHLHDWVFHFNIYTNQWAAIPRNLYNEYWSDYQLDGIIRSKSFKTLLEVLQKTNGVEIEKKLNIE